MSAPNCWLAAVAIFFCLHLTCGIPTRPEGSSTIDEAIEQASGGREMGRSLTNGGVPQGMITDGLDMVLTPKQYWQLRLGPIGRATKADTTRPWVNHEIPYKFKEGHFGPENITRIEEAMADWENLTCIVFRPASRKDENLITIFNGGGCWSYLGMLGSEQLVSLNLPGCFVKGIIIHEMGHAMGLIHEHQRPDRDNYITVDFNNVNPQARNQLTKYAEGSIDTKEVGYSYESVMHYGKTAFSVDGESQTIITKDGVSDDIIGQRKGLAYTDVRFTNQLYKCDAECKDKPVCPRGCFVDKHCKCFCEHDMPGDNCVDENIYCDKYYCYDAYGLSKCQRTCGVCTPTEPTVTTGECKNFHPDEMCDHWEAEGYCYEGGRLGDWMSKKCKRSCRTCNGGQPHTTPKPTTPAKPTTPTAADCEDENENCPVWASSGHCSSSPGYMHKSCKKSCDLCAGGSSATCKDDAGSCSAWAEAGYCQKRPDYMLDNCKKSCGVCV